jgi:hypothetical protein
MNGTSGSPKNPDRHKGAIEGDQVDQEQHANQNAAAGGDSPDPVAVAEDRIGANVDDSEVSHATETGRSADTLRDEERPLE